MSGKGQIRFSALFQDTLRRHGAVWARHYYTKRGMSAKEFGIWFMGATS